MPDLRRQTRGLLARLGVRPEKRRSQNFMVDEGALAAVASALPLEAGESAVEIGPGLGFLTRELLARGARVVAVEKDFVMSRRLRSEFPEIRLIEGDVLAVDLERDAAPDRPSKVFGNIPYNITSPILEWLVSQKALVRAAALTVQLEVARRLVARPGTREWGALSVFVAYHAEATLVRKIGRGAFEPAPNVDSAIVRLDFPSEPRVRVSDERVFFETVRRAFQKRRKTVLNALESEALGLPKPAVAALLERGGIDARRRPETLSLEEWAALSGRVAKASRRML